MKPTTHSMDEYHIPLTPEGTIEFVPDPKTGEEQIDLRLSELDQMARKAINLAVPRHDVDPSNVDTHRIEVVGAQALLATAEHVTAKEMMPTTYGIEAIQSAGAWICEFRRRATLPDAPAMKRAA